MPSRSVRRRQHKQLARIQALPPGEIPIKANQYLMALNREVNCRAKTLDGPTVWSLTESPSVRAMTAALDSSGELQADVNRLSAEALSRQPGAPVVRGSRPLADRGRLLKPKPG